MHVHPDAFLVLHHQIGLGPLGHLDHHGDIAVGLLMVDEVAHIALCVDEDALVHFRGEELLHAEKTIHRPEGIPVPDVAVVDGAGVDKGEMNEAPGLLEQRFNVALDVFLQRVAFLSIHVHKPPVLRCSLRKWPMRACVHKAPAITAGCRCRCFEKTGESPECTR